MEGSGSGQIIMDPDPEGQKLQDPEHCFLDLFFRLCPEPILVLYIRYKENPNIANESAHAQAREALKKYLHYFERVIFLFYEYAF
jgi:hypothetical protein